MVMCSGRKKPLFVLEKNNSQALSIPWESHLGIQDAKSKTSKEVLSFFTQLTKRELKDAFLAHKVLVSV